MSVRGQGPTRWRKKPVVIEAMLWDGSRASVQRLCEWVNSHPEVVPEGHEPSGDRTISYLTGGKPPLPIDQPYDVRIWTLEGDMEVAPGDWVIKGVAGEFYPCKPGIFAATYEAVNE